MTRVEGIAVPGSLYQGEPEIATYRIGLVGRAAAIYGLERIIVYNDGNDVQTDVMTTQLRYQSTAPYLRKRLFPLQPALNTAAHLPPLNLATHTVTRQPQKGEVRQAVVLDNGADIGLSDLANIRGGEHLETGEVIEVRVAQVFGKRVTVTPVEATNERIGHAVHQAKDLREAIKGLVNPIHATRHGQDVRKATLPDGVSLIFGGQEGLEERPEIENLPQLNTVPDQHTATVRSEEAVMASLAVLNVL